MVDFKELISVVIPTYKNRGGLVTSIESVLNQTYKNLEVIVVDDNSPMTKERESTELVMLQYANNSKVVYIKHEKNKNGAAARNTGIKHAKGKYIAFLDDDDLFLPTKLEKQIMFLTQNTQFDAVYCLAQKNNIPIKTNLLEGNLSEDLLLLRTRMFTPTLMFTRESLERINGFDESFSRHQDYELLLKFFSNNMTIGLVPIVLTEIGANLGENIPSAEKLLNIKDLFFQKFTCYIDKISSSNKRLKKEIYVLHYSKVALAYLKEKNIMRFLKLSLLLFMKSPSTLILSYFRVVLEHI